MDYGDYLETAAAQLARAHAILRQPRPPDPAVRASAALARIRLYRSVERQVVAVGGVREADLPQRGVVPDRQRAGGNQTAAANLATALRYATAHSITASEGVGNIPPIGPAAVALHSAHQALQIAGDILISNTGPYTGPGDDHQPSTADGIALLAGVGRENNLAAVARLAAAAADMDVRLARWLWPEEAPAPLGRVLAAAEQDAWQTKNGSLRNDARTIVGLGHGAQAPVRALAIGPAVDDPHRWASPASLQECVAAVDAARAWLTRRGDDLTVQQVVRVATAAVGITRSVGHVQAHTTGTPALDELAATTARPWRGVLEFANELRSPVPDRGNLSTLTAAMSGVATWLQGQLRPAGQWADPPRWAADEAARSAWRTGTAQILSRMPDLADQLHDATLRAHGRGGVLTEARRLIRRPGQLIRATHWVTAPPEHPVFTELLGGLRAAGTATRALAARADVAERPGVGAAAALGAPMSPAKLAGQWYPQSPAEPVERASRTRSRAAQLQGAPQVKRR
ncbi:hypothetical protein SAMN05421812_12534 [Asanoa hainanensis]|uniref:Uncharacterized protein n=1 Tax=Asanoa hainanensis TaxID=560556 RepID=A0A239PF95_9ACTN|nr:hypothetical protein [Asanoa hainanensis]SNT65691.1 hypothetical protein SAMN05421812_12534 [Asanoa hainanensis]